MKSGYLTDLGKKDVQEFIISHESDDERKLVLSHKFILGLPSALIADQIAGRRKARTKLPEWYRIPGIIYPAPVNLEQSSSQHTARYKAGLLNALPKITKSTSHGLDLTTGYGIDSYYLSSTCDFLECVDPAEDLLEIARHNHMLLGTTHIQYHGTSAERFLATFTGEATFIYIDPSRRLRRQRVFKFADCEPNVARLLPTALSISNRVLIKASPLMDLQQGSKELGAVEKIVVVAVENECREVLFLCSRNISEEPVISCINLSDGKEFEFTFTFSREKAATSRFSAPLTYLYEPHAAIQKSGGFKSVGNFYGLYKLQASTHLYTSNELIDDFPGRIFRIEDLNPDKAKLKSAYPGGKVNVLTRNYPLSADELKKKLKVTDGGEKYLIAFSGIKQKFLVAASRLK